ncbi:hypothetical protein [Piscibacillus salipiscarius]|nr:hypothetical protein [Piscibacillus salipiscarius]
MIYYVEVGTEFTNTYGDIDLRFYNSLLSMYEKAIQECERDRALYENFKNRLSTIVHEASGIGWGYHDELEDLFYSNKYELEEEHEN